MIVNHIKNQNQLKIIKEIINIKFQFIFEYLLEAQQKSIFLHLSQNIGRYIYHLNIPIDASKRG